MNKYFNDIDLSKSEVTKVNALIDSTVKSLFTGVQSSSVNFLDKTLEKETDYKNLIEDILVEAFPSTDDINKCKALFAIYISGLDVGQSNMFGLICLLLVAIRSCGSLLDIDVYNVCKTYTNEIRKHNLEPKTVGSISKCNFLGEKINFDANDSFANTSDDKYFARLRANVNDYDKAHNPSYRAKMNAHRRIDANLNKLKDQPMSNFNKQVAEVQKKGGVNDKGEYNIPLEQAIATVAKNAHNFSYKTWLRKGYDKELETHKTNLERLTNQPSSIIEEDFD